MKINSYTVKEKLYESNNSIIYIAVNQQDNKDIIIKMLPKEYPTPEQIAKFKLEYDISSNLKMDGIIKMHKLEQYKHTWYIVMEYFDGLSLDKQIEKRKFELEEALNIVIKITEILGNIHNQNIIHKDINPSNILWNAKTDTLKIIDFGISTRLAREVQAVVNPKGLEGSLFYISPEQTGRMNRNIDYRTDFYSLGITFYELITGKKPFEADDMLELIHYHIAKMPEIDSSIPEVVSEIIMKLMAKNAEERYQSTFGLKKDLEKCLEDLKTSGNINYFPIAKQETLEKFEISQKLYGREKEIENLLKGFETVVNKEASQFTLVKGYSGIGKSVLVHEIYKPVLAKKGYLLSGKFDQLTKNKPYLPLIQAFGELFENILTEEHEIIKQWKEKILKAVGNIGQIIINLIPQVELIIGKQPDIPELDASREKNRFNMLFESFVQVLASKEHPLVIFIDDLQWADMQSLKMLEMLITNPNIKYIYFIGAYRDNEVDDTHPLINIINEIQNSEKNVEIIKVRNLGLEDINSLISDVFNLKDKEMMDLSKICIEKTDGNPFFLNQFLKSIYEENLIEYDNKNGIWTYEIEKLKKMSITDNVVDLMITNIKKLSEPSQEILKLASCCGNIFDLDMLSVISQKTKKQTNDNLCEVLEAGLILASNDNYKFVTEDTTDINVSYKFLHDRVQQAAYSLIDDDVKKHTHLKIGRLMLDKLSQNDLEDKVFEVVNNLNIGAGLICDNTKKEQLARLNLKAGKKAKKSSAYDIALLYFSEAKNNLKDDSWACNYDFTLDIHIKLAEILYVCGNYEEMDNILDIAINHANNVSDKIRAYEIKMQSFSVRNKLKEAVEMGLQILKLLDFNVPTNPNKMYILGEILQILFLLKTKSEKEIITKELPAEAKKLLNIFKTIVYIGPSATYTNRNLLAAICIKAMKLCIKHGICGFSPAIFGIVANVIFSIGFDKQGIRLGMLASKIAEKYCDVNGIQIYYFIASTFVTHHYQPLKNVLQDLLKGHTAAIEFGDMEYAGVPFLIEIRDEIISGKSIDYMVDRIQFAKSMLKKLKQNTSMNILPIHKNFAHALKDNINNYICNINNFLSTNNNSINFLAYTYLLISNYYLYKYEDAQKASEKAFEFSNAAKGMSIIPILYFFDTLVKIQLYFKSTSQKKRKLIKKIENNLKKLKKYASQVPSDHNHKCSLIEAELENIRGNYLKAMEYYDMAIEEAAKNEYIQEEAIANECAARFYFSIKKEKIGYLYLIEARSCYKQWGAEGKIKHLDETYPDLSLHLNQSIIATKTLNHTINSGKSTIMENTYNIDLTSVIKVSQAISEQIEYIKLLEKLMNVVAENVGAQKVLLLVNKYNEFGIEAEYDIKDNEVKIQHYDQIITKNDRKKFPISIVNFVNRTKEMFVNMDLNKQQFENDNYIKENNPKSFACMPFIYQGNINRILYIENNVTKNAFTKDRIKMLNLLSTQMIISIENASLYKSAVTDGLTQLNNRTFFDNYLMKSIYEAQRYGKKVSLLILDIDYFKKFNDTYGHLVGDLVLKDVAKKIIEIIRKSDVAARYGGEEFVVVMPETGLEGAKIVAEKIRAAIEKNQIEYVDNDKKIFLSVTVSIGVAELEENEDRILLIEKADKNLYRAKENGRNRIEF